MVTVVTFKINIYFTEFYNTYSCQNQSEVHIYVNQLNAVMNTGKL